MVSALGAAAPSFAQLFGVGSTPPPTATSSQAATVAPSGSVGFPTTDSFQPANGSDAVERLVAKLGPKPEITDEDLKDEKKLLQKKEAVARYTMMVQLISAIQQMFQDMIKAIIGNFR